MKSKLHLLTPSVFNVKDKTGWLWIDEEDGGFFDKPMISDPLNGAEMKFAHYGTGYWKGEHRHGCAYGVYVIDGEYKVGDRRLRPGSFVWNPAGKSISHGASEDKDCRILYISNRSENFRDDFPDKRESFRPVASTAGGGWKAWRQGLEMAEEDEQLPVFNIFESVDWIEKEEPIGNAFYDKQMIVDRETGMVVNFSRYPAGFRKPRYQLNCAHGMYIIKGAMVTDHGVFGPGNFIWYPKGCACEMTVTADEDCLFLFVTNRNYRIQFLG